MNKVYKSVWNASAGTYVAAAENVNSSGRKSSRRARNIASAAIASAAAFGSIGFAQAADPGTAPRANTGVSSTGNASAPAPTNDWFFCFLFWCGGGGGSTTNVTYNGVSAQDAYAYTYDRNNLKYFHVNSALPDSSASGTDAISIGGGARANGTSTNGMVYGSGGGNTGNGPVAIGAGSLAQGAADLAVGVNAQADGLYHAVALGGDAQAASTYTSALGGHSLASADGSTALGSHASALAAKSIALGYDSVATRANTVSVGKQGAERQIVNVAAGSAGTDAVNVNQLNAAISSIGGSGDYPPPPPPDTTDLKFFHANSTLADSTAGGSESVAIGGNASALAQNAVALGSSSRADRANSVSIGSAGLERQLTNLAAGTTDTDAVNVKQLNTTVRNAITGGVPDLVQYDNTAHTALTLGGIGASQPVMLTNVAPGAITQNSTDAVTGSQVFALATATNQGFQEIGTGFGALAQSTAAALGGNASAETADGSISAPSYKVAGKTYHDVGSALDALGVSGSGTGSPDAVTYDTSAHDRLTLGGVGASTPVRVTNVAAAQVKASSKDAVNGGQLYTTANSIAGAFGGGAKVNEDGSVTTPVFKISGTTYSDIASAMDAIGVVGKDVQVTAKYVKVVSDAPESMSLGSETTAIGGGAFAAANRSLAIGTGARAQFDDSIAIGSGAQAYEANTLSVGHTGAERRITNVADGTNATDAATVGQLTAMQQQLSKQNNNLKAMAQATATPVTDYVKVSANTTPGAPTYASSDLNAMALGPTSAATGVNSLAVGSGAGALRTGSTAVGSGAAGLAINATVVGLGASTGFNAQNGVSVGYMAASEGADTVSIGTYSVANANKSLSMGMWASTLLGAENSVAIGNNASVSASNSVALGADSVADRVNTVSVGNGTLQRQIVNVAAGTSKYDAVNVDQLKGVTASLGGGADVNANGTIKRPTYTVSGQTYTDVGSAIAAAALSGAGAVDAVKYDTSAHDKVTLGGTSSTAAVKLANVAAGKADTDAVNIRQLKDLGASFDSGGNVNGGFVAYDDSTKQRVTLRGSGGTKIAGVAAGSLAAGSTEAVNGAQLYQTNQDVANVAGDVTNLSNVVNNITINGAGVKYFHANSALADSSASGQNTVAVGGNARATANGSVALGSGALADRANTVSVGASGAERQVVNVAAGTVDTDAVNLKQLKDLGANFDTSGNVSGGFVAYDDSSKTRVTLGGKTSTTPVTVANVAAGKANNDAVNVKQLKDLGASFDTSGNVTSAFVAYDDANRGTITLKGTDGTKITKLAAGTLSASSTDAVNGAQLYKTNQDVTSLTDVVNNITVDGGGVKYFHANSALADSSASGQNTVAVGGNARATANGSVALGSGALADRANTVSVGASGAERQVVNVAAGTVDTDAVNLKQLKDLGANFDTSGNVSGGFVAYDDSSKTRVTLGGKTSTTPVTVANVAAGKANNDAVNVKQLKDLGASFDTSGNVTGAFVAYDDANRGTITLKGTDGTKITKLAAGTLSASSTDAVNGAQLYKTNQDVTSLTDVVNNITVDGGGVKYFHANSTLADSSASGQNTVAVGGNARATANGSVALGSGALADRANTVSVGASGAERQVVNVAAGTVDTDAVNLKQLKDLGANFDTSGNVSGGFVAYDDSAKTRVTLGGKTSTTPVTVANVAAGKANNDAVNVKQLKDLGASFDTSGNVTGAFVAYDDANRGTITLKGTDGTKITKLAAGTLSASSTDAVNGAQLYKTNQDVTNVAGDVTNLTSVVNNITNGSGIKYFSAASTLDAASATGAEAVAIGGNARATSANSVALGANALTTANLGTPAYQPGTLDLAGTTPVGEVSVGSVGRERRVTNVAAGAAGSDAVNVSQLKSAVAAGTSASLASAVQYDTSARDSVTLGGVAALAPVALKNVAAGQLAAGSRDAVNGAQLFNTASSTAAALGGGATAGSDGKIKAPTYTISGNTYGDVGSALAAVGYTVETINSDVTSATKFISVASDPKDPGVAQAKASGNSAVAIGSGTFAYGIQSLAIGPGARTSNFGSMAFGSGARATEEGAMALGTGASALFANSVAIGYNSKTDEKDTVSFGTAAVQRRITHIADGLDATDAATVGQLATLKKQLTQTGGVKSMALLGAKPVTDYISVSSNTTAGSPTHASDDENAMAIGPTSAATGRNALAVGAGAGALRSEGTAIGAGAAALSLQSTVVGNVASTGFNATAGVAVGYMAAVESDYAVAIGAQATGNAKSSVALGDHAATALNASDSIALGSNSFADRANTISVGNAKTQRQIVNVAAGSGAFDAVNVTQLKGALSALGGGAGLDANGAVKNPSYTIGGQTYTDVGAALVAASEIGGVGSPDAVKYDTSAHNRVTLGGTAGAPVTLTNLAAGAVSASSRDAINGAQLFGTANSIASALGGDVVVGADGKVTKPAYTIKGTTYDNVGNAFSAVNSAIVSGGNPNAVVYDTSARDRITLGASTPVTLTNVANAKADSDAVNLGQLKAAGLSVDPSTGIVSNAFVAYDNTSKTSVTFNVNNSPTQLKNIADGVEQFDAVNVRQMEAYVSYQFDSRPLPAVVTNALPTGVASGDAIAIGNGSVASGIAAIAIGARTTTAGDNSVALGVGASAPATNAVALGANSVADRDNSVSMGAAGAERQVTNVAAGSAPTDAVNVSQLSSAVSGLQKNIHDMDRDNRRGIASASALNIVTPYLPGRTTLNAGVAGYRGTAAVGLGVSRWNEKGTVNYNLGVSSAGGNSTIVRAGVGVVFGN